MGDRVGTVRSPPYGRLPLELVYPVAIGAREAADQK